MHSLVNRKAQRTELYPMRPITQQECIKLLEEIRWNNQPCCPYCGSKRASAIEKGLRYHCNDCFTSYSVTVGTLFHKTHVPLQKWFKAIFLVQEPSSKTSVRKLAQAIEVNKDTAAQMLKRLREADLQQNRLLKAITKRIRDLK